MYMFANAFAMKHVHVRLVTGRVLFARNLNFVLTLLNLLTDNRREFTIQDVQECGLLSVWPTSANIPFVKIVEDTHVSSDSSSSQGLYQFAHLSFQGE